uniref:Uncharacterized protein n=1 Tax=Anopheles epiroticus TaxID=199890 RepID=A0A182P2E8_9DIPT
MSNSAMVAVAICCILVLLAVFIVLIIVVGSTMGEPKIWMDFVPPVLPLPPPSLMGAVARIAAATSVLITDATNTTTVSTNPTSLVSSARVGH